FDLAVAKGQELLGRNLSDAEFVKVIEAKGTEGLTRFTQYTQRAMQSQDPQLQATAGAISKKYEAGMLGRARDPDHVKKNIKDLMGNMLTRDLARNRLHEAGEYAMAQLVENLFDRAQPALQAEVQRVIIEMGRQAIIPLCTAMMKVPPAQQEQVADVLG